MGIPPSVQPLWDVLQQEVVRIHAYWINYRQLFGKSKERIDLLNDCAGQFFFIISDSLLTDVQLSLSRLADPAETFKKENAALERLLKEIAALNIPQFPDELATLLQNYRDRCKDIKVRRDKELAHADLGALLQRYGSAAGRTTILGPSRQEIERALAALREFMNAINIHFIGCPMNYEEFILDNACDGESLVGILKQGLRYDELRKAQELPFEDLKKLSCYDASLLSKLAPQLPARCGACAGT
ncbi:MAG: hypothetical protein ABSH05_13615 [Bryobacteraceae bacterium]|jgi:hypothetical protein